MATETQTTEWEPPGEQWQRFAAGLRARNVPHSGSLEAARALQARRGLRPANLDEVRRRIRKVSERPPLGHEDLQLRRASAPDEGRPEAKVAIPTLLDVSLQDHIERFLRFRLPRIEIHNTAAADRMTRRLGADAIASGNAVYFRKGAYQPQTPSGLGLLAHEATHIAWTQGAHPFAPAGPGPAVQEERTALANERRVASGRTSVPLSAPAVPPPAAPAPPPAAPPAFSKAALASRDTDASENAPAPAGGQLSEAALHSLKGDLYRMLLDKIRSEFERGA